MAVDDKKFGLTVRLLGLSSIAYMNEHPEQKICSLLLAWKTIQATNPAANVGTKDGLTASAMTTLNASISHAHDNNYELMMRVMAGVQSPGGASSGRSGAAATNPPPSATPAADPANPNHWLLTGVTPGAPPDKPVVFMTTYSADPGGSVGGLRRHPVPWDTNLAYWHQQLMDSLADWADEPCPEDAGHKRSAHIHSWPVARGPVEGSEMTLNYGKNADYPNIFNANKGIWDSLALPAPYTGASTVRPGNALPSPHEVARRALLLDVWKSALDDFLAPNPALSIPVEPCCSVTTGSVYANIAPDGVGVMASSFDVARDLIDYAATLDAADSDRILFMITNLNASGWSNSTVADVLKYAADKFFYVGFQFSAGGTNIPASDAEARVAQTTTSMNFNPRRQFYEPAPSAMSLAPASGNQYPRPAYGGGCDNPSSGYEAMICAQTEMQPPIDTVAPVWAAGDPTAASEASGIVLEWPTATDAVSRVRYEIRRSGGPSPFTPVIVTAPTTTWTDTTTQPGVDYVWSIQPFDAAGNGSGTRTVSLGGSGAGAPSGTSDGDFVGAIAL